MLPPPTFLMQRSLLVALLSAVSWTGALSAQVSDDRLVPGATLRAEFTPSFTKWDSRFGWRPAREELGTDLTAAAAESLLPGIPSMIQALEGMGASPGFGTTLGSTESRLAHDVTRLEFGAHLGVFEWLTIGVMLPRVKSRTDLEVVFLPDTVGGQLGLSPTRTNRPGVDAFLSGVQGAASAARDRATQLCGAGAPECTAAQGLADRAESFATSAQDAYDATGLFPIQGSGAATSVDQFASALDADLVAAGLAGFGSPVPFATEWLTADDFIALPTIPGGGIETGPLGSRTELWAWGDAEVSATVRLLEGGTDPGSGVPSPFSYRILGGALVRLGTGRVQDPDTLLDLSAGDGQLDIEGRLSGAFTFGARIGLRVGARYGVQRSRTVVRRVVPPETILAPLSSRQSLRWTPGTYWALEFSPGFLLTDVLSFSGEYRLFKKARDTFELADPGAPAGLDTRVLSWESGVTVHQVGGRFTFDSVARWRRGAAPRPFQVQARILHSVSGSGGQTPISTRVELGFRLFRGMWGSS